ncbi:AidA/PixA family protein [Xenorhabdus bovienii]|uniref:AidA/PixA family protein n=1 Tax=Xenorhabdus bovienii TaxID=40576 RepID=UPI0023B2EC44|nr:AidA/PixA family protein [Xenorhabdus bovienii]MDE9463481.1 inclusion body family protein [Xenorhabdus bovienii]MDE9471087.1 inclusion body family protein [Xenorhabdus bovienii]
MADFNIFIGIDEKAIVRESEYSNNPAAGEFIDSRFIHVMTYNEDSVVDNHGDKLSLLSVKRSDNIIWRAMSLSPVDSPYSSILTSLEPEDVISYSNYVKRAVRKIQDKTEAVAIDDKGTIDFKPVPNNYWLSAVQNSPPATSVSLPYTGRFTIYNGATPIGYCQWKHILILTG